MSVMSEFERNSYSRLLIIKIKRDYKRIKVGGYQTQKIDFGTSFHFEKLETKLQS